MSNVLTSTKLIKSIKRKGMVPKDQNTFEDEDFLDMLNEEIQYFAVPHLMSVHEEYLVSSVDLDIVDGKTRYRIPERAIANKLRDVAYIDNNQSYYELSRISLEDLSEFSDTYSDDSTQVFYVENDEIVLVDALPFNTNSGKLRMYFYLRPNRLVLDNRASIVQSIDRVTGEVTVSNYLADFNNIPKIDFVQSNTPNKLYKYDVTPSSVSQLTGTLIFTPSDIPENLAIGDYINLAGETIVPQLPTELHPVLAQRVAVAALEALGDEANLRISSARLKMMEDATLNLIDNRVEGAPQKIRNRYSPLRQTKGSAFGISRKGKV